MAHLFGTLTTSGKFMATMAFIPSLATKESDVFFLDLLLRTQYLMAFVGFPAPTFHPINSMIEK